MTTQKNNNLLIVIAGFAITLFLIAFIWGRDNQSNIETVREATTKPIAKTSSPKLKTVKPSVKPTSTQAITISSDEREIQKQKRIKNRTWAYQYITVESIQKGIEKYKSEGDYESVAELEERLYMLEEYNANKDN